MMKRTAAAAGSALTALLLSTGCLGSAAALFDPGFLSAVGLGQSAATLPGDAPALVVALENRINAPVTATISFRGSNNQVQTYVANAGAGEKTARALVCTVSELTVGNIADLNEIGVIVTLGDGQPGDPTLDVEPFGVLLREGANYDCGDAVTFAVLPSGATRSGYQVYAFIQRAQ